MPTPCFRISRLLDALRKPGTILTGLLVTVYFMVALNTPIIATLIEKHTVHTASDGLFIISAIVLIGIIVNLVIHVLALRPLFKPWLCFLILGSAIFAYYIRTYHVLVNADMIQNIAQTDYNEATALLSPELVLQFLLFGVVPCFFIVWLPVHYEGILKELLKKGYVIVGSFVGIALIVIPYYQDYASLFRNNHYLRDEVLPINYLHAGYSYLRTSAATPKGPPVVIGEDASIGSALTHNARMAITVLVVGETARAANFSLGGYSRETNPELAQQDIVYLDNVHSCGTATAVSVPCMFSDLRRKEYDDATAKHRENLLDVVSHTGIPVLWRDNNSGCKGVCERVEYEDMGHVADSVLCGQTECFDEVLLKGLEAKIFTYQHEGKNALLLVLHQHGSHGPDYFERVPAAFLKFQPYCHTNQIQECTRQEIINSYDNTILYTDHVLSLTINFLKKHQNQFDSSLVYLSDHGESLGEKNLYLHGLPYSIAPEEQIHVPAILWLSDGYASRFHIDISCLKRRSRSDYSHDNLFHSILGLLDIHTRIYQPDLDLFAPCKSATAST